METRNLNTEMSNTIPSQVASAPSLGAALPEMLPDLSDGYAQLLDEENAQFGAAFEEDGTIASCIATREGFRGKGLSSQLLSIVLNEAKQAGFEFFKTVWRMANLPISKSMPAFFGRTEAIQQSKKAAFLGQLSF